MQSQCYQVGDWVFSSANQTLSHMHSGRCVELDPRTAQLLLCFILHPGEVLSRDELIEAAWNRSVVTDHAITQSIFELRRALRDNRSDAPAYIQTLPKRGYQLVATVVELEAAPCFPATTTGEETMPAPEGQAAAPAIWRRHWRGLLLSAIVLSVLAGGGLYFVRFTGVAAPQPLLNPTRLMVSYSLSENEQQNALLVGLGDFLVYKLNGLTRYDVTQVSHEAPAILAGSGRVLTLAWVKVGGEPFIRLRLKHRISQKELLDKRYPSGKMAISMVQMLNDLLHVLSDRPVDPVLAEATAWNYPSDQANVQRFFDGHYQFFKGDQDALRKGAKELRQLAKDYPDRPIVFAELAMSELVLSDLSQDPRWRQAAELTFSKLDQLAKQPHLPPVVFEAQAMRALYSGKREHAMEWVDKALAVRDTWHGQVIRGKLAEMAGRLDEAGDAYARAYMLKPDTTTLLWIGKLAFPSDIQRVAPPLAAY